jgi:hypothetical protein
VNLKNVKDSIDSKSFLCCSPLTRMFLLLLPRSGFQGLALLLSDTLVIRD